MSDLEFCRLAHDGKLDALREKIVANAIRNLDDLSKKKDSVNFHFKIE